MKLICGIDEAGRGPVIGPLVVAGALIKENEDQKLVELGVKDSKLLTPLQREQLFDKIKKTVKDYKIIAVEPKEIDAALNSDDLNLNWLESLKTADIINKLNPDRAIVDCPSSNIEAYSDHLKENIKNKTIELVVEHKADANHPSAAAASILAKVTRDREIEKLKQKIGIDFGSGYPSDPKTAEFLKENYKKYKDIFRKTWASYKEIVKSKGQGKLTDF